MRSMWLSYVSNENTSMCRLSVADLPLVPLGSSFASRRRYSTFHGSTPHSTVSVRFHHFQVRSRSTTCDCDVNVRSKADGLIYRTTQKRMKDK